LTKYAVACFVLFITACGGGGSNPDLQPLAGGGGTNNPGPRPTVQSLVIAPMMGGTFNCQEATDNPTITNEDEAARLCASLGKTAGSRIESALAAIGPKTSPSGEYQLGYTLIVPLFRYFTKVNGAWKLDTDMLKANLATIADVDRPVVVHLSSTHFTYAGLDFSRELAQDTRNLQWTRSGPVVPSDYFNVAINAWTLADFNAPVNVARREAMNGAIDALCTLPAAARERIVGVSVLGETHDVFPNLETGPTFDIRPDQLTDYSPVMTQGFRVWLSQKYTSINQLNQHLGASFASFDAINAPAKDLRTEQLGSFFEHMDNYAAGKVSFAGWVRDQRGRNLSVQVLVDGKPVGNAGLGYSRTDVAEALGLTDPNVGFRYSLDFRQLGYGSHTVEVLVNTGGPPVLLAKRELVYIDRNLSPWSKIPATDSAAVQLSSDSALSGGLDAPGGGLVSIFYNPMADLWLQFRNQVVRQYLDGFARIAAKSCISRDKVFSHQISPALYGSWNSDVLAVDGSLMPSDTYLPGTTLYGGAARGGAFTSMRLQLGWERYAVNEMHPLAALADEEYAQMFNLHRIGGAVFVAPYYMNMVPQPLESGQTLDRFMIDPRNTNLGSDKFYNAIKAAMAR
jgi:Beta-galactosidase